MKKRTGRELPPSTARLIAALCGEYTRMKDALGGSEIDRRTGEIYRYLLSLMLDEAERCLSLRACQAEELIMDIAANRGYALSQLSQLISRKRYYSAKRRMLYGLAARLRLI